MTRVPAMKCKKHLILDCPACKKGTREAKGGEPSDADLLKLAHEHKYVGPPAADLLILAMLRAARSWTAF